MKKIISTTLVCILMVCMTLTLASCVFTVGSTAMISGDYTADHKIAKYNASFSPFGKITVVVDPIVGNSSTHEGKYKVNTDTNEITFTWEGDAPSELIFPTGTVEFNYITENGEEYIEIAYAKFTPVK